MKVEYTVGAFLTETDIVTHTIPEVSVDNNHFNEKINNMKNVSVRIRRKTEQTTKKKMKPADNQ